MEYNYIQETKNVLNDFKSGAINKEQARLTLEKIENKAFEVYPDAEPDGDITYCVASAWGEISEMKNMHLEIPEIKIRKEGDNIICRMSYDGVTLEAGYKPDGITFVLGDEEILNVATKFTIIGGKMFSAVWDEFNMNPGDALQAGLVSLEYCKQMQAASIIGYDLAELVYYNEKSRSETIQEFLTKYQSQ